MKGMSWKRRSRGVLHAIDISQISCSYHEYSDTHLTSVNHLIRKEERIHGIFNS